MIEYHVLLAVVAAAHRVGIVLVFVAQTATQIAHDDIAGVDHQRPVAKADAVAGSTLACDGDVVVVDAQRRFEMNVTVHLEDHDTWAYGLDCLTQAARALVGQCGDNHHPASTATRSVFTEALCTRESQRLGLHAKCGQKGQQKSHRFSFHRCSVLKSWLKVISSR